MLCFTAYKSNFKFDARAGYYTLIIYCVLFSGSLFILMVTETSDCPADTLLPLSQPSISLFNSSFAWRQYEGAVDVTILTMDSFNIALLPLQGALTPEDITSSEINWIHFSPGVR